jgi:hypothetical protein
VARAVVTLIDLEGRVGFLEIRCSRCGRRSHLRLARLIAEHGPDAALRTLRDELAGTCPRRTAEMSRRCNVYFPQVVGLFRRGG